VLFSTEWERLGLVLLVLGLSAFWLLVSREVLRSSPSRLVNRVSATFFLLVAVSSVNLRIAADYPESASLGAMVAFAALTLGVLGVLGATRVTTFLTAFALARAGVVFLALPAGVHGRAPGLLALAASGVSLLLLAAALENVDVLDDVARLGSAPRRLVLTWGALSAASFPPFPGFVSAFPLASALFDRGYLGSLVAAAVLLFLLVLGSMRIVSRAWASGEARTVDARVGRVEIALAALASWFFTIAPASLAEIARVAGL
jgi:formate hydrogenlyase subunit 3/multisubunit Na+/H+ antiporter MnhD subunit